MINSVLYILTKFSKRHRSLLPRHLFLVCLISLFSFVLRIEFIKSSASWVKRHWYRLIIRAAAAVNPYTRTLPVGRAHFEAPRDNEVGTLLSPFYGWGNGGTESNSSEFTQNQDSNPGRLAPKSTLFEDTGLHQDLALALGFAPNLPFGFRRGAKRLPPSTPFLAPLTLQVWLQRLPP